jgi:hypothetical protein
MGYILNPFTARVKENFEKNSENLLALLVSSAGACTIKFFTAVIDAVL